MASTSAAPLTSSSRSEIDAAKLPPEVRAKLAQLDLELSEGDITQKGYDKKRTALLSPYISKSSAKSQPSPGTRAHRRHQRRLTSEDNRYHSDSSSDEESLTGTDSHSCSTPIPEDQKGQYVRLLPNRNVQRPPDVTQHTNEASTTYEQTNALSPLSSVIQPPPSSHAQSAYVQAPSPASHVTRITIHGNEPDVVYQNTQNGAALQNDYSNALINRQPKVSQRIQQLLHTLQRPRKKPLHEYYSDDDKELEALAHAVDPTAPKAEGATVTPARASPSPHLGGQDDNTVHFSLVAALHKWATQSSTQKLPVCTVLDQNGRPAVSLTYAKLLSRSTKLAHYLMHKLHSQSNSGKVPVLKSGDRVALVYPNNDPINFSIAFYACLMAGLLPVAIEDAGLQQVGFLLAACGVRIALTSESCHKGLPRTSHNHAEVIEFKGWPHLTWITTEHMPKPPRDWKAQSRLTDETVAYIEYTTDVDGSVKGVCVTRAAMMAHCRALTAACQYHHNEVMVCVLDFKREVGLWHAIQTSVYNGMQVVFVPYALMKINPSSWMSMVTRFKASTALVKSRDLHWALSATKDTKDIDLASLRVLLVADGANPWSLSSCDAFANKFNASCNLRTDALCPCAGSSESLTVAIRRPSRGQDNSNSGRGVLSMSALSHCVVRVDSENSLTSLTLQDAGQVIPGGAAIVVKIDDSAKLCKADEVGEICLYAHSTGNAYWGLEGKSASTFKLDPIGEDGRRLGAVQYTRTGLIGFLGPGALVFVVGTKAGSMHVGARYHQADDIIATVLAVEPMKFVYRGRIAVFSVPVLRDERIVVVAEQRSTATEEDSFKWMSRVIQAVDSIHQVGIYCLALVDANHLPKTPLGGIHVADTRARFIDGSLHATNLLMCPHSCVTNLPKPRETPADVGPAAMFVGNIVQGIRIANASGRAMSAAGVDEPIGAASMIEQLAVKAHSNAEHVLYTFIGAKIPEPLRLTCATLYRRAEKIGVLLLEKGRLSAGDHVALIFPPGLDLIVAFYGCLSVGMVPVCIRPPHAHNLTTTLPTVRMIVDVSRSVTILSTTAIIKLMRSKEAATKVDVKAWPTILDIDDAPKNKRLQSPYRIKSIDDTCYLDFSVSTTGTLAGIEITHSQAASLCKAIKLNCELYPSRSVCLSLDPYCSLGFALWCLSSVYAGHETILIPPTEVEQSPTLWLSTLSQEKVRDTFCSYGIMELCVRELASQVSILRERGVTLSSLRTCVVVAEERPRIALVHAFAKLFQPLGLKQSVLSTSFGCRANPAICVQGASSPETSTVYVDARALRNDRVTVVEKGAPHSIALMECGELLPGVRVVIANPETKGQCADSHLGEIWVTSPHNAKGYFSVFGDSNLESNKNEQFCARLSTGDTCTLFARTGFLGFLRQTDAVNADGNFHDAVFVVGALDETFMLRGMRYHPVDVETTVQRAHKKICECAVFTWTNLLVVVAELDAPEGEALDLVPAITSRLLEEQYLICGVVVVIDPAVIPINSRGEKQRMHLRDAFLQDKLDPIYVAYNM